MSRFIRQDIMEAYCVLEWDYNKDGWVHERPRNRRTLQATSIQLARCKFEPRRDLCFDKLTFNGRAIYRALEQRYGFTPANGFDGPQAEPFAWSSDSDLNEFICGYVTCMLWAENDEDEESLDANYSAADLSPAAREAILDDCGKFFSANRADIVAGPCAAKNYSPVEYAGHDFWLTRQHHGCGFWDGDWAQEVGERLTTAAHKFGECYPYVQCGLIDID